MEKIINQNFTKKFNEINKIINTKKNYNIKFLNDDTLSLMDSNKEIIKAKYTFYGLLKENQFIWATSIPLIKESFKLKIKKLKENKKIFYDDYVNNQNELSYFFYTLLDNNTIIIPNKFLKYINKLIMYLTDDIFLLNPPNSKNNIQYISLTEIIEVFT